MRGWPANADPSLAMRIVTALTDEPRHDAVTGHPSPFPDKVKAIAPKDTPSK
jgi:hypothetical protein